MDAGICKSCGASLWWAVTDNGSKIPLDAKHEMRFVETGVGENHVKQVATYQTHFVTCPEAAKHRKARV